MKEAIDQWIKERFGIDASRYRHLAADDLKNSKEFEKYAFRNGWTFNRKEGYPVLYVHTSEYTDGPNGLSLGFECETQEQWDEVVSLVKEASAIVGEDICSADDLVRMRKGRHRHGKIIKEGSELIVSVQIDFDRVDIWF